MPSTHHAARSTDGARRPVRLADYRPPAFHAPATTLEFIIEARGVRIRSRIEVTRNGVHRDPFVLFGEELDTQWIAVDGARLEPSAHVSPDGRLTIRDAPDRFAFEAECRIDPQTNTALSGLYLSRGIFCTQCEPEGFRRMTWFPDRPDVLSGFTVTIDADAERCPVLLSNGNRIEYTRSRDGRHRATWRDPWPKPSYLFALVAGDLGCLRDEFVTRSGRRVALEIHAEHHNVDQCDHAMASLKKAMAWDERAYGREYDLDVFMIAAVDDFNMGAMENKGLNVFNSKYILARRETATDADYEHIENVIGHEYFHNWSGNRVTCRDWFQLSLKEGFTVFRDQQFSADSGSRGVKRIDDVNVLRVHQFPEDNGPMAHPVRPDSYFEINNFYTATVYQKGAEVVRMVRNLLGPEPFRRGCDHYFATHDGEAVTTDDFLRAHEHATDRDLGRFRNWYTQAGTPRVETRVEYHEDARRCDVHVRQSCPPTPGQDDKAPFHVPIAGALFGGDGAPIESRLDGERDAAHEHVFELTERSQTFTLHDVGSRPVASLLRGFSAPVRLDTDLSDDDLAVLAVHDDDPFNRWDAGQRLAMGQILRAIEALDAGREPEFDDRYLAVFKALLDNDDDDRAFQARTLDLPAHDVVAEEVETIDPHSIHRARTALANALGRTFLKPMRALRERLAVAEPYAFDGAQVGRRALCNRLLRYMMAADPEGVDAVCRAQFREADNMTDRIAALDVACAHGGRSAEPLLAEFFETWKDYSLVVDKWFAVQVHSPALGALERVETLLGHPAYESGNPNKVRALVGEFVRANPSRFHRADARGYEFLERQVSQFDERNPQIAARLASTFNQWRRYAEPYGRAMQRCLERIHAKPRLSPDVREIVERALA